MKISFNAMLFIVLSAMMSACGIQYPDPVAIKDLKEYNDEITGFSVKYPGNWVIIPYPGKRFTSLSSSNAKSRFIDYNTEGFPGAKIDVSVITVSPSVTIANVIDNSKIFDPKQAHYKITDLVIDGVAGKKLTYNMELEDGAFRGETYIVSKSPNTYTRLTIETFANTWDVYKKNLNEIIKSFKPATRGNADTVKYTIIAGNGYSIAMPETFSANKLSNSSRKFTALMKNHCTVQIDVIQLSSTSDFNTALNSLHSKYSGASPIEQTTLGGKPAHTFSYSSDPQINSKVWIASYANKLYRVTTHVLNTETTKYKHIVDYCIQSLSFK